MKHFTPLMGPAVATDIYPDVVVLRCPDQPQFDPVPLIRLFTEKDPTEAEDMVCRILEDIARRLDALQEGAVDLDYTGMLKPARRIGLIADQIGLTEVSVAAYHVVTCLCQRDNVAVEATLSRLERAFDVAVSEVWNFRDYA